MAKAEGGQDVTAMTDGQMFEELIKIHAQSAGEAISSILRADIEIGAPRLQEMTIKDVEYGILEPAIFVKSCLTSQVAGNIVLVLRQRDMQVFLNELMGVDDLPDPDFVFDDVAMSAAGELMNQMSHASASSMAEYLGDTMDLSDCQLVLSDGSQYLALVIGEPKDAKVMVVSYTMKIKDMVESEFIECISSTAMDSLTEEIQARRAACEKARQEEEEAQKRALIMEQNSVIGQDRTSGTEPRRCRDAEIRIFRRCPGHHCFRRQIYGNAGIHAAKPVHERKPEPYHGCALKRVRGDRQDKAPVKGCAEFQQRHRGGAG